MQANDRDNIQDNTQETNASSLVLFPGGTIGFVQGDDDFLSNDVREIIQKLKPLFSSPNTQGKGLLELGLRDAILLSSFRFWHLFSRTLLKNFYLKIYASDSDYDIKKASLMPWQSDDELMQLIQNAPFLKGIEYLTPEVAQMLWQSMLYHLTDEMKNFNDDFEKYLRSYNFPIHLPGKICFHLAENKSDSQRPFAFLATYQTTGQDHKALHRPLAKALSDFAHDSKKLFELLLPIHRAAKTSTFIKNLVDSGGIFNPIAWSPSQTYQFLKETPLYEASGIVIRVPNWWKSKTVSKVKVAAKIGSKTESIVGMNAMLDFDISLCLDGKEELSENEIKEILQSKEKFIVIKGQLVEIDAAKLQEVLNHFKNATKNGIALSEALRFISGAALSGNEQVVEDIRVWGFIKPGEHLAKILNDLKNPSAVDSEENKIIVQNLKGTLRPYQKDGLFWLWTLYRLGLGGLLADDMGLGKTIQMIALFLLTKRHQTAPHLLVIPASLISNWRRELLVFAPSLKIVILHPSESSKEKWELGALKKYDIVITTYSFIHRHQVFRENVWDLIVLDEAQNIKNAETKQSRAARELKGKIKLALTGTPIENNLGDLWAIFDFTSLGLLGSRQVFSSYVKHLSNSGESFFPLRSLVAPYILRRLKTDKKIINDLPDKTELKSYCFLTKKQMNTYQNLVEAFSLALKKAQEEGDQMKRRGLVLAYLMKFKQVCNHPKQVEGIVNVYEKEESGKFLHFEELISSIKEEKMIIFTQFKEIMDPLATFIEETFNSRPLLLHGQTSISERGTLVERFQQDEQIRFFILSLKAGGTGLNLTAASHVVHFDRWWNPAVENQATDRAYRIGQKKNVLVHKFITKGTIEEKIDQLIETKKSLASEILGQSKDQEINLTEMSNDELLKLVSLDINQVFSK
ncbi:MAG: hypothetical protein A2381_09515 [Bdellovibrionales bacterium RIFOXYB1_FULL_37_110]|nr:MAG: hypothetical protein A2417_02980 [Bdellovibrionales bacterium RIFOXYC1_FULL_37_79]OFZ59501.1 MAG: hypothetical protein A2381_09515 [Bdellovibrionales bacterium RIFOXYB1_FULL_37_110]OFZ64220.1 MAG: hypothetical protein A2577_12365 [Bdellovibrionales bacterium RIFOXYD1_FULL_36_51]